MDDDRTDPPKNIFQINNSEAATFTGKSYTPEAPAPEQKPSLPEPNAAEAAYNQGDSLREQGNLEAAIAHYQQATILQPNYAEAHYKLAFTLRQQGKLEAAIAHYYEALFLKPNYSNAHNNLAVALAQQGKLEAAITHYQEALVLNPNYANAHNNLAVTLAKQGKLEAAVSHYQEALSLIPNYAEAHNNLAVALGKQGKLAEASNHYQQALNLNPHSADAHSKLAFALSQEGKLDPAIAHYKEALLLNPQCVSEINSNIGFALQSQGKISEALTYHQLAINQRPDSAEAHLKLGMGLLLSGDLKNGFSEYEWRWQTQELTQKNTRLSCSEPLWDGSDLEGRTIFLYPEQGFGDSIQFIRYAVLVQQRGGKVIFECPQPLWRLFSQVAGIDRLIHQRAVAPEFQVRASLMSLPYLLGTTLETVPSQEPYLAVPERVEHQLKIQSDRELRVGLVWACRLNHPTHYRRSCPLSYWLPLLEIPGIAFYSLQKEVAVADLELLNAYDEKIQSLSCFLGDFAQTAAIISQLDLVITVDTAVAHLAGAMGKPVWVVLPFAPDWRWMLEREDSPWYPTMRLFRQSEFGEWQSVFGRVFESLQALVAGFRQVGRLGILPKKKVSSIILNC
ncbi:MAG: tetratricopeptide repeat protein [Actinomycetota bacterium]